jgi:GMP synthase (glutamine-hydrolysing)
LSGSRTRNTGPDGGEDAGFTLLVIQPDEECPVERFGPWLIAAGARLVTIRPWLHDAVPERVEADGLMVLGGDMGAQDDGEHPWLPAVRSLTATAVADGVPTLGICLGGQILAAATGGTVTRGTAGMESGVIEVRPRPAILQDPLMRNLPWPLLQGSMHRDAIIDLPPGATWLAESTAYPHQAFRLGKAAWGVQFHPELSPARYRRWAEYVREDEATSARIQAGVAQFDDLDDRVSDGARTLARAFASVCADRSSLRTAAGSSPRSTASGEPALGDEG